MLSVKSILALPNSIIFDLICSVWSVGSTGRADGGGLRAGPTTPGNRTARTPRTQTPTEAREEEEGDEATKTTPHAERAAVTTAKASVATVLDPATQTLRRSALFTSI